MQGIVLLVVATGYLPYWPALAAVGLALGSLVWSFGRDIAWLWRVRCLRQTLPQQRVEMREQEPAASMS